MSPNPKSKSRKVVVYRMITVALVIVGVLLALLSWRAREPGSVAQPGAEAPPTADTASGGAMPGVVPGAIPFANPETAEALNRPWPGEAAAAAALSTVTPGANLYALPGVWQDAEGTELSLTELQGRPAVFTFAYANCPHLCPLILEALEDALTHVPAPERNGLQLLIFAIDPPRDTPAAMSAYLADHGLDRSGWRMLTADEPRIRALADQVGFRFQKHGASFSHNALVAAASADGAIRGAWSEGLTRPRWLGRGIARALASGTPDGERAAR